MFAQVAASLDVSIRISNTTSEALAEGSNKGLGLHREPRNELIVLEKTKEGGFIFVRLLPFWNFLRRWHFQSVQKRFETIVYCHRRQ